MRQDQKIKPGERIDFDRPSLPALSYILRHEDRWPTDFEWCYNNSCSCAIGLANRLWPGAFREVGALGMIVGFGMSSAAARNIFSGYEPWRFYGVDDLYDVKPEMVADKIDEYLSTL